MASTLIVLSSLAHAHRSSALATKFVPLSLYTTNGCRRRATSHRSIMIVESADSDVAISTYTARLAGLRASYSTQLTPSGYQFDGREGVSVSASIAHIGLSRSCGFHDRLGGDNGRRSLSRVQNDGMFFFGNLLGLLLKPRTDYTLPARAPCKTAPSEHSTKSVPNISTKHAWRAWQLFHCLTVRH
ncbi:hypothetical protein EVAR_2993_1 [Eumeta japonica]|uniref:Uncharacterized protein n=1 Tax=Eumeta variegata TaxID=151549 RepID=A0A4C1SU62_EUMVA|nr:hypothetical protein EVAR_2993_1 [Eumeta japonica]